MEIINGTLFESSIYWTFPSYLFKNLNGTEILFSHLFNSSNETIGSNLSIENDDAAYTLRYGLLGSVLLR